jgi:hypothetical protein
MLVTVRIYHKDKKNIIFVIELFLEMLNLNRMYICIYEFMYDCI